MERKAAWSVTGYVVLLAGLIFAANLSANAAPPPQMPAHSVTAQP